jgi:hypothetical protein
MPDKKLRFQTRIAGKEAGVVGAITPPVDVPEFFGTRGRVPVRGTINGFAFRSISHALRRTAHDAGE